MAGTRRARTGDALKIADIVRTALELVDQVGLDGLSMRNLADRLGIRAATLYWYIRDKHELLSLLAEAICAEIEPPDPTAPWPARLEALMGEYRRVLLRHRDAAHVLAATPPAGAARLRLVDISLSAVLDAGFKASDATRAGRLLVDYTTGFVQDEYIAAARRGSPRDAHNAQPLPTIAHLEPEAYPHIAELQPYLIDRDGDARFAFGLGVILNGLQQYPAQRYGILRSTRD
jgi:TetR/AcrR family transcriptional regulator, tetracycline repressor protein